MNLGGALRLNKFSCFILVLLLFLIIYWRSGSTALPRDKNDFVNLKTLLKAAVYAAELGGKSVVEGKDRALNVKSKGKTKEGANDPVTDADFASHCAMFYSLKNSFSSLNVISEEHTNINACKDQSSLDLDNIFVKDTEHLMDEHVYVKDVTVWIDPLDATQEYTEGLYEYVTTMVCVAIKGVPVIGVVHYPFFDRSQWGWFTKQTSSNIPNVAHNEDTREHPKVIVSRSHPGKVAEVAKQAFGDKTVVTTAAGAGYKAMNVVTGKSDIYLHTTAIKKWDICAGDAILKTVGGKMTTTKGDIIDYSSDSAEKVTEGIIATRYDHDFYISKLPKVLSALP